jgi:hypothetical protein
MKSPFKRPISTSTVLSILDVEGEQMKKCFVLFISADMPRFAGLAGNLFEFANQMFLTSQ